MSAAKSLLDASDLLSITNHLMEAVYMAATSLANREKTEAIQHVCQVAQQRLSEARQIVEAVRKGDLS